MTAMRRVHGGSTGLLLLLVSGCGAAARSQAPPVEPQAAPVNAVESAPAGSAAPATESPSPPPPAPAGVPVGGPPPQPEASRASARAEVERAERDLDAAGTNCEWACRALGSMERATTHLCSLADQDDDRRRCEDARRRLSDARSRVRSACGVCP
jgi:hypothetical protein